MIINIAAPPQEMNVVQDFTTFITYQHQFRVGVPSAMRGRVTMQSVLIRFLDESKTVNFRWAREAVIWRRNKKQKQNCTEIVFDFVLKTKLYKCSIAL